MMDVDNAELSLQCANQVDFQTDQTFVAQDLNFILENTALCEPDSNTIKIPDLKVHGSSETEDSSDNVKITSIKTPSDIKEMICVYSSSSEDEKPRETSQKKNIALEQNTEEMCANDEEVVQKLLANLVLKIDQKLNQQKNQSHEEVINSDENNNDRVTLATILDKEENLGNQVPKSKNEISPEDLPEDEEVIELTDTDLLLFVGLVSGVVEEMIVIEADKAAPAVDADTAFFLHSKIFLGKVFDTFGPVKHPFYSIRISSKLENTSVERGTKVFFVPYNQNLTKYVFVDQLKKLKGSDASWMDDCEPPAAHIDYSDDEEERRVRSEMKRKRRCEMESGPAEAAKVGFDSVPKKDKATRRNRTQHVRMLPRGNALLEHAVNHQVGGPRRNNAFNQSEASKKFNNQGVNNVAEKNVLSQDGSNPNLSEQNGYSTQEYISPLHQAFTSESSNSSSGQLHIGAYPSPNANQANGLRSDKPRHSFRQPAPPKQQPPRLSAPPQPQMSPQRPRQQSPTPNNRQDLPPRPNFLQPPRQQFQQQPPVPQFQQQPPIQQFQQQPPRQSFQQQAYPPPSQHMLPPRQQFQQQVLPRQQFQQNPPAAHFAQPYQPPPPAQQCQQQPMQQFQHPPPPAGQQFQQPPATQQFQQPVQQYQKQPPPMQQYQQQLPLGQQYQQQPPPLQPYQQQPPPGHLYQQQSPPMQQYQQQPLPMQQYQQQPLPVQPYQQQLPPSGHLYQQPPARQQYQQQPPIQQYQQQPSPGNQFQQQLQPVQEFQQQPPSVNPISPPPPRHQVSSGPQQQPSQQQPPMQQQQQQMPAHSNLNNQPSYNQLQTTNMQHNNQLQPQVNQNLNSQQESNLNLNKKTAMYETQGSNSNPYHGTWELS